MCELLVDYSQKKHLSICNTQKPVSNQPKLQENIQLTRCFTYISCAWEAKVEPFGVCSTTQDPVSSRNWLIFPRAWMAMKTILRNNSSNLNRTWHFKRMKQQFCLVIEPHCLKNIAREQATQHLWKKITILELILDDLFHTTRYLPVFLQPLQTQFRWMLPDKQMGAGFLLSTWSVFVVVPTIYHFFRSLKLVNIEVFHVTNSYNSPL